MDGKGGCRDLRTIARRLPDAPASNRAAFILLQIALIALMAILCR